MELANHVKGQREAMKNVKECHEQRIRVDKDMVYMNLSYFKDTLQIVT